MKNKLCVLGLGVFLVFGLALTGCGDDEYAGSPFVGTWHGTVMGAPTTVVISAGATWSVSVPAGGFSDSGTYTGAGTVATLYSNNGGGNMVGTATANASVVDGSITSITLYLNSSSAAPGTYTLTKG